MSLDIPDWMVSDDLPVRTAARGLRDAADVVDDERAGLRRTLGEAAAALGWEGQITDRADEAADPAQDGLRIMQEDLRAAGDALDGLAGALDQHTPTLRDIQRDWDALHADRPRTEVRGDVGEDVSVIDWAEVRRREDALRDRTEHPKEMLRTADRGCRDTLAQVRSSLAGLQPGSSTASFTRSQAPEGAWQVFRDHGLANTRADEALLARIAQAEDPNAVRALLDELDQERLAGFLQRNPHVMAALATDYEPRNADDAVLSGLWDAIGELENGQVTDPRAIADIRDYWAGLTPQEQQRMRLLYPTLIGSLDGIPVEHRAAANRLLVESAIDLEQQRLAVLQAMPDNAATREDVLQTVPGWYPDWVAEKIVDGLMHDKAQRLLHDFRLRDQEVERSRKRLAFYNNLLAPKSELRFSDVTDDSGLVLSGDHRAILLFDPRGDGRYAEWHGEFDSENVGIFVPGTTTDMSNIGSYAQRVERWAREPNTSGVTWMGIDLPNSVASDATQTRYSEDGGQALLRFVEGLGMSERTVTAVGHSAGGGIVGFGDVYGMDVDRTLLVAPSGSGLGLHRPLPWPLDPWGAQPSTPDEYPPQTWDGHDRDVQRFTQTAPGDSIAVAQASEDVRWWVGLPEDWGHGDNPNSSDQFIRLETGRWTEGADAGQRLEGRESHRHVVKPGTDAWANTVGVITGGDVIPYREDGDWIGPDNVYDDPDYPGTHPVPIDDLESPWEQSQPEIMAPGPLDGSFGQGGEPA
ncbi:alpha/beta hydrolase [Serinicoccus marinus]|uniref:alpha/beta hydrolase n=1 Tax=Serinicoccus marinus TaxID=247333 RepID=UPI0024938CAB|nr:alpha/beta hydrolase [Serinicoccus marinus]